MRHRSTAEGPVHVSRVIEDLGPLFQVPPDMVRHPDHETSLAAARGLLPHLTELQERVLDAFRTRGPMTDEFCEQLHQFSDCAPSTVRKRRSELVALGKLQCVGRAPNTNGTASMKVWACL